MIGHIYSLAKRSDAAVASASSAQQNSPAKKASLDQELISLCQNFRAKLDNWINQVGKHGIESYDDKTEAGRALHALRVDWGNALSALRNLTPHTVAGATEKVSAARVFLTFCCDVDGSAIELLVLANRELDQIREADHTFDQTQTLRRSSAQGPFLWLQRLTRRA